MKPMTFKYSRFKLTKFLDVLHQFGLQHLGNGDPLPAVSGDIVYHDDTDLAEALSSDVGEEFADIAGNSLARLKQGLSLYGQFAAFDGFDTFECADGDQVELPDLDEEDDEDEEGEPQRSRRQRTKTYRKKVENTVADENSSFGFKISLVGDKVEIEAKVMCDVSGDCELEAMVEPNLLSAVMTKWVQSFLIPKRGGKS